MKSLFKLFVLLGAAVGVASGDPNIYGPGGVNLGPNGELPKSRQQLQQEKVLEEEREQTRLLEQQVQELRQIQRQQEEIQRNQQYQQYQQYRGGPLQIEINYGTPYYSYPAWSGGSIFWGGGVVGVPSRGRSHGIDRHRWDGKPRGMVGHPSRGGGRGRSP